MDPILAGVISALAGGILTYLGVIKTTKTKAQEIEVSMVEIANKTVAAYLSDLKGNVDKLEKEQKVILNLYNKLSKKYSDLHANIIKLRACFSAVDIHLQNYIALCASDIQMAERYLPHLNRDMAQLRTHLEDLCEVSEPLFDAADELRANASATSWKRDEGEDRE